LKVFIENAAGSLLKHLYNEKTLQAVGVLPVSRSYPFPYGFVLNTTAEDGDNVDCFVLTAMQLHTGEIVECEPVGLMEQIEDGEIDHKVLAVFEDENFSANTFQQELTEFALHVFEHIPGKVMRVGEFRDKEAALKYLSDCRDSTLGQS
jgi:inorganic pyrophosphatase